jgi:hypothetical protein
MEAAAATEEPFAPIEHRGFGAIANLHLDEIGLDLMLAFTTPDDQSNAGDGSVAEGHRRGGLGFHLRDRPACRRALAGFTRLIWLACQR